MSNGVNFEGAPVFPEKKEHAPSLSPEEEVAQLEKELGELKALREQGFGQIGDRGAELSQEIGPIDRRLLSLKQQIAEKRTDTSNE